MSKLAILLSISGALLAGSTFYLANELRQERARSHSRVPLLAVVPTPSARTSDSPAEVESKPVSSTVSVQPQDPQVPSSDEEYETEVYDTAAGDSEEDVAAQRARIKAREERQSREFLRRYDDPQEREKMVAAIKANRSASFDDLKIPGFTQAELNDLQDLRIQQGLAARADSARCALTPDCTYSNNQDRDRLEIAALLGPEKFRQYEAHLNTTMERRGVSQLRLRLDDTNALSEADAERLVQVLAEERQKFQREAEASGAQLTAISTADGVFYIDRNQPGEDAGTQFSKRLRKRATEVLSPSQQKIFDRMQEDLLVRARQYGRNQ